MLAEAALVLSAIKAANDAFATIDPDLLARIANFVHDSSGKTEEEREKN